VCPSDEFAFGLDDVALRELATCIAAVSTATRLQWLQELIPDQSLGDRLRLSAMLRSMSPA